MAVVFAQRNPTLDKVAARLLLAGAESRAPILSGLHADVTLTLRTGERLKSVAVTASGFSKTLTATITGTTATISNLVFGTDTSSGAAAVQNTLEWVTTYGTIRRQFWVKDLPSSGSLYVNNQDAQGSMAVVYTDRYATDDMLHDASISINILPYFADEFTIQHWYTPNSYANTLRCWGGATTAQVFIDGASVIAETDVADIHGYYWSAPTYGIHSIIVRLRAATASAYYVDIRGHIRVRQIPCT